VTMSTKPIKIKTVAVIVVISLFDTCFAPLFDMYKQNEMWNNLQGNKFNKQ
jgi:hypothetical protein